MLNYTKVIKKAPGLYGDLVSYLLTQSVVDLCIIQRIYMIWMVKGSSKI